MLICSMAQIIWIHTVPKDPVLAKKIEAPIVAAADRAGFPVAVVRLVFTGMLTTSCLHL